MSKTLTEAQINRRWIEILIETLSLEKPTTIGPNDASCFVNALRGILATQQPEPRAEVTDTEPQWIVNDLGELGVKVGGRFFFLYKGDNIEYGANSSSDGIALHDDGSPMQYRIVGKREFGETCLPVKWILQGRSEDRYHEKLVYDPRLSFGKPEDGDWKLLPAARAQGGES